MVLVRIFAYGPEEVWNYEIIRTEASVRSFGRGYKKKEQRQHRSSLCFSTLSFTVALRSVSPLFLFPLCFSTLVLSIHRNIQESTFHLP
jgi:hypothetical protein